TVFFVFVLIFAAVSFSADLFADSLRVPADPVFESESYVKYIPFRKQENGSGKISITEASSEQSLELKTYKDLPVNVTVNTKYIGMNEATDRHFPGYLTTAGVDIDTTVPFFGVDKTFLNLGVNPSFYSDTWDFSASSFRIPLRAAFIYQCNSDLALLAGLDYYPGFENRYFPILGFIYKPDGKLAFNITTDNPNITYALSKKTDLFVEANAYLDEEFNTTRDNVKNVTLEYREISIGGGINHKVNSFLTASLSVGDAIDRVIKYKNSPDVINIADGMYTELKFNIKI
ncbi:MAG: hypothetical protein HQL22_12675, partial [Candidatus Omnitrophica bacterium]|nr:hypothetical protein [Candidatus Omnitrophota bacterium]